MRQLLTPVVLAGVIMGTPGFGQQAIRITPGTDADRETFLARREALLQTANARAPIVPEGRNEPATSLILPFFRVDRAHPAGETTLFALRNVLDHPIDLYIRYFDSSMVVQRADGPSTFGSREIKTVNIRDIPGLPVDPDGYSRGMVFVDSSATSSLSGDFFQVDPTQNFATGDRLVDVQRQPFLCELWDMRFLNGGPFSGGTDLRVLVWRAPGTDAGDPPAMQLAFFDETGQIETTVWMHTAVNVLELSVKEMLPLEAGYQPFGAVEIWFSPSTIGGVVTGTFSAEGRYSVGMPGTCLVPII